MNSPQFDHEKTACSGLATGFILSPIVELADSEASPPTTVMIVCGLEVYFRGIAASDAQQGARRRPMSEVNGKGG
ncbi:MAG TPA: hypothetical protein VGD75_06995 [Bradyrhizobium sp.]